jgi:hypothetical protein
VNDSITVAESVSVGHPKLSRQDSSTFARSAESRLESIIVAHSASAHTDLASTITSVNHDTQPQEQPFRNQKSQPISQSPYPAPQPHFSPPKSHLSDLKSRFNGANSHIPTTQSYFPVTQSHFLPVQSATSSESFIYYPSPTAGFPPPRHNPLHHAQVSTQTQGRFSLDLQPLLLGLIICDGL